MEINNSESENKTVEMENISENILPVYGPFNEKETMAIRLKNREDRWKKLLENAKNLVQPANVEYLEYRLNLHKYHPEIPVYHRRNGPNYKKYTPPHTRTYDDPYVPLFCDDSDEERILLSRDKNTPEQRNLLAAARASCYEINETIMRNLEKEKEIEGFQADDFVKQKKVLRKTKKKVQGNKKIVPETPNVLPSSETIDENKDHTINIIGSENYEILKNRLVNICGDDYNIYYNDFVEICKIKTQIDQKIASINEYFLKKPKLHDPEKIIKDQVEFIGKEIENQYKNYMVDDHTKNEIGFFLSILQMLFYKLNNLNIEVKKNNTVIKLPIKPNGGNITVIEELKKYFDEQLDGEYTNNSNIKNTKDDYKTEMNKKFDKLFLTYDTHSYISSLDQTNFCEYVFLNLFYQLRAKNNNGVCEHYQKLKFEWSEDAKKLIQAIVYYLINQTMKISTMEICRKNTKHQKYVYGDYARQVALIARLNPPGYLYDPHNDLKPFLKMLSMKTDVLKSICLKTLLYNFPSDKSKYLSAIRSHQFSEQFLLDLSEFINYMMYNMTVRIFDIMMVSDNETKKATREFTGNDDTLNKPKNLRDVLFKTKPVKAIRIDGAICEQAMRRIPFLSGGHFNLNEGLIGDIFNGKIKNIVNNDEMEE